MRRRYWFLVAVALVGLVGCVTTDECSKREGLAANSAVAECAKALAETEGALTKMTAARDACLAAKGLACADLALPLPSVNGDALYPNDGLLTVYVPSHGGLLAPADSVEWAPVNHATDWYESVALVHYMRLCNCYASIYDGPSGFACYVVRRPRDSEQGHEPFAGSIYQFLHARPGWDVVYGTGLTVPIPVVIPPDWSPYVAPAPAITVPSGAGPQ